MLPFLKDHHEGAASMPVAHKEPEEQFDMLDAISDDLLTAIHSADKKLLKATLGALLEHIREIDERQDANQRYF
jgi:hypothetical protein